MYRQNKLEPQGLAGKLLNFLLNIFWAVVWLGRWSLRLMRKLAGK